MFSERTNFAESPTLGINSLVTARKAAGYDVISFGAGAPTLPPPVSLQDAIQTLDLAELFSYGPSRGNKCVRESISSWYATLGMPRPESHSIQLTSGAKQGIMCTLMTLCNPGDTIAVVRPHWPSYQDIAQSLDLNVVYIDEQLIESNPVGFDSWLSTWGSRFKALVFSSPSNPTGNCFTYEALTALLERALKFDFWVVADEIYQSLYFDGAAHAPSVLELSEDLKTRVVHVNSASKMLSLMGLRCGWVIGGDEFTSRLANLISNAEGPPSSVAQALVKIGLELGPTEAAWRCHSLQERRDALCEALEEVTWLKFVVPRGGLFVWAELIDSRWDVVGLTDRLLYESDTAVVPGTPFGSSRHLRLSFVEDVQRIYEGVDRISKWGRKTGLRACL